MKKLNIKSGNTGFNPVFVLSFDTEKSFVTAAEKEYHHKHDLKTRREMLREVYQIALTLAPQLEKLNKTPKIKKTKPPAPKKVKPAPPPKLIKESKKTIETPPPPIIKETPTENAPSPDTGIS
ncbi:MAG: hypothetical protein WCI57_04200 [Candidatus Berkelbacteria bacterium]